LPSNKAYHDSQGRISLARPKAAANFAVKASHGIYQLLIYSADGITFTHINRIFLTGIFLSTGFLHYNLWLK
jgi:hypothetical protein